MVQAQIDPESLDLHHVVTGVTPDQAQAATGTVNLISSVDKDVVLIPAPSNDPRDPLNLPTWRKWAIAVVLSIYSCTGLTVVSAAGALISFFLQDYIKDGRSYNDIVHLITIPTLSMGVGNFVFMPIALAVGRRPVYLFSCALLFISCIIATFNTGYKYHLAIRIVIGFAAGQSEALVPLMLKESFFLHERANILAFQSTLQGAVGCALSIVSSNIAAAVGWRNWYAVYAGISGVVLIFSILIVPETKFERPLEAYNGMSATTMAAAVVPAHSDDKDSSQWNESYNNKQVTQSTRPSLDYSLGKSWSLGSALNPLPTTKPNWDEAWGIVKHMCTMILFPNVLLIIIANSWFLGINIAMGTTYGTLLTGPVYHWADKWTGVAQAGQIPVAFLVLPLVGFMSDRLVTYMARRNNGVHEPEVRLLPLLLPTVVGVVATILFGYTWDHPTKVHWFAIVFSYAAQYLSFIAASVAPNPFRLGPDARLRLSGTHLLRPDLLSHSNDGQTRTL
ncbi:MFS general substrate transporter [Meredithblackwellia eburnea MCA 4105]